MPNTYQPTRATYTSEYKHTQELLEGSTTESDFLAVSQYAVSEPVEQLEKQELRLSLAQEPRFIGDGRRVLLEGTMDTGVWMAFAARSDLTHSEFKKLVTHSSRFVVANALLNGNVPEQWVIDTAGSLSIASFPSNLRERIWGHVLDFTTPLPQELVESIVDEGLQYEAYVDVMRSRTAVFTDSFLEALVYPERHGRNATKYPVQIALLWCGRLTTESAYDLYQRMSNDAAVAKYPIFADFPADETLTWSALNGLAMPFDWVVLHVISHSSEVEKNIIRRWNEFQAWLRSEGYVDLLDLPWEWLEPYFRKQITAAEPS